MEENVDIVVVGDRVDVNAFVGPDTDVIEDDIESAGDVLLIVNCGVEGVIDVVGDEVEENVDIVVVGDRVDVNAVVGPDTDVIEDDIESTGDVLLIVNCGVEGVIDVVGDEVEENVDIVVVGDRVDVNAVVGPDTDVIEVDIESAGDVLLIVNCGVEGVIDVVGEEVEENVDIVVVVDRVDVNAVVGPDTDVIEDDIESAGDVLLIVNCGVEGVIDVVGDEVEENVDIVVDGDRVDVNAVEGKDTDVIEDDIESAGDVLLIVNCGVDGVIDVVGDEVEENVDIVVDGDRVDDNAVEGKDTDVIEYDIESAGDVLLIVNCGVDGVIDVVGDEVEENVDILVVGDRVDVNAVVGSDTDVIEDDIESAGDVLLIVNCGVEVVIDVVGDEVEENVDIVVDSDRDDVNAVEGKDTDVIEDDIESAGDVLLIVNCGVEGVIDVVGDEVEENFDIVVVGDRVDVNAVVGPDTDVIEVDIESAGDVLLIVNCGVEGVIDVVGEEVEENVDIVVVGDRVDVNAVEGKDTDV